MPKGDPIIDFAWLKQLLASKGLLLVTAETPAGVVHVDGKPPAFAAELIRLAEIGQKLEATAAKQVAEGKAREIHVDDIARLVDPAAFDPEVMMDEGTRSSSLLDARMTALRIFAHFSEALR